MPTSNNNALNAFMRQSDEATAAHTQDATVSFGAADPSAVNSVTGNLYFGSGNPNQDFGLDTNGNVQTGLSVIHRQGDNYSPVSTGAGASATYNVLAGTQTEPAPNAHRAEWNINYVDTVQAGGGSDTVNLGEYISKFQITETRPGFVHSEVFDLNATTHVWQSETSSLAFGGDDHVTGAAATGVSENSLNVAFLANASPDIGYGTLAQETTAGTEWDARMSVFAGSGGQPNELAASTIHVLIGPTV